MFDRHGPDAANMLKAIGFGLTAMGVSITMFMILAVKLDLPLLYAIPLGRALWMRRRCWRGPRGIAQRRFRRRQLEVLDDERSEHALQRATLLSTGRSSCRARLRRRSHQSEALIAQSPFDVNARIRAR